jgi:GAF domain-containing protein
MERTPQHSTGGRDDALVRHLDSPRPRSSPPAPFDGAVARELDATLRAGGPHAALLWLNARTRFRYTGLYRADPPLLRNLFLVDRENPGLNVSGAVCPLDETYCAIACAREASFTTTDARLDARLATHPARSSVISYAGVPLRLAGGRAWGTLCHYDLRPRLLPPSELTLLDAVAPIFVEWLGESGAVS